MAKVVVDADCIDIRASLLERMMLAEKSRRLPLSRVRSVNPHPPLLDMMVHWADHERVWLGGVSSYEGHMIPSTRNPRCTLAIEIEGEDEPNIYVEVDNEPPESVAARISRAIGSEPPAPMSLSIPYEKPAPSRVALEIARAQQRDEEEEEDEEDELLARQRRDPLSQGSLAPPPMAEAKARGSRKGDKRDLGRIGGWLLGLGSVSLISGSIIVAAGVLPGLVAVAAGVACSALGGIAVARNH